jgi:putative acetyltransferase
MGPDAEPLALRIREARDEDADDLIALVGACFAEYPGCVLDVDGEIPELRRIASAFSGWGGQFWVAERAGRAVASIGWVPAGDAVELCKLYVDASERRQGLAHRLCERVEEVARRRGAACVELWSDTRFETAHLLYEKRGYQRGGETRLLHDLSDTVEFYYRLELGTTRGDV